MPRDRYECFPILSCATLSWPTIALPCAVLFSPILSCNVLFCPVLSYPILYCPTLSCSVLFLFLSCPAVAVHCTHTTMQSFSLLSSYSSLFFSTLFGHVILARHCVSRPAFFPYALHVSPISTPALTPSRPVPSLPAPSTPCTGARQKIGFRCALKLLRCGASVIATTRFPIDATKRFLAEGDSSQWSSR